MISPVTSGSWRHFTWCFCLNCLVRWRVPRWYHSVGQERVYVYFYLAVSFHVGSPIWLVLFFPVSSCSSPRLRRDPRSSCLFYRHLSTWPMVILCFRPCMSVISYLATVCSSFLLTIRPYQFSRFSAIILDVCVTLVIIVIHTFLALSFFVTPHICLNILISFVSLLASCHLCYSTHPSQHPHLIRLYPCFVSSCCCRCLSSVHHYWSYYWFYRCSPSTSLASFCRTTLHCMSSSFSNQRSLPAWSPFPWLLSLLRLTLYIWSVSLDLCRCSVSNVIFPYSHTFREPSLHGNAMYCKTILKKTLLIPLRNRMFFPRISPSFLWIFAWYIKCFDYCNISCSL